MSEESSTAIDRELIGVDPGFHERAAQEPEDRGPMPTDYLPVMRHHLALAWLALTDAARYFAAQDLLDTIKLGRYTTASPLSGQLQRAAEAIGAYVQTDEEEQDEQLPEQE